MIGVAVSREDLKQEAAIQRRQLMEAARKERIFNPKRRLIGKDKEALQAQLEEKRQRAEAERSMDAAYARENMRQGLLYRELQKRMEADRQRAFDDLNAFRKDSQKFEDRREFDLNNPRQNVRGAAAPTDDQCGPSSLRKFEGEDFAERRRKAAMDRQKEAWLEAQIREKEQNKKEYEAVDILWEQQAHEHSLRSAQLAAAEECARFAVEAETAQYNRARANEAAERKKLEKLVDEQATLTHQLNMYNSELLTETTDATHINGPFRTTTTRYKGWSPEQIKVLKEEQHRQILDNERRKEKDTQYEDAWAKMQKRYAIAKSILDKELDERKRDQQTVIARTNRELAREQQMRQEYLNRIVYRNSCSEDFFQQFNTSTR